MTIKSTVKQSTIQGYLSRYELVLKATFKIFSLVKQTISLEAELFHKTVTW